MFYCFLVLYTTASTDEANNQRATERREADKQKEVTNCSASQRESHENMILELDQVGVVLTINIVDQLC